MPRPQRLQSLYTEHPIYYITACAYNRRTILGSSAVHESFIQFGLHAADHGIRVGPYVIMPDHIHLLAGFEPESMSVSKWVKSLKNAISKTPTNTTFKPPHWQKGFFDHVVRSSELYAEKCTYIRNNPLRAGLVHSAEDWQYAGELFDLGAL